MLRNPKGQILEEAAYLRSGRPTLTPRVDRILKFVLLIGLSAIIFARPLISGLVYAWTNTLFFALALFLVFAWFIKSVFNGQIRISRTRLDGLHLLFFAGFAVSWYFSINPNEGTALFLNLGTGYLVYFLIIQVLETEGESRLVLGILLTAACLVCFFGLYQSMFGLEETREFVRQHFTEENLPASFRIRLASPRIFSTMIYPNTLAGYLLLIIPLIIAGFGFCSLGFQARVIGYSAVLGTGLFALFSKPEWVWAVLLGAVFYPLTYLITFLLTYSKGGFIAFFILRVFTYFVFFRFVPQRNRKIYFYGVILAEVLISGSAFIFMNDLLNRALLSLKVRLDYWQAAFGMIRDFTWHGTGPGTFGSIYASYKLPGVEETRMAHNNFLQMMSELGVITGTFFAMIWLVPVYHGVRRIFRMPDGENNTKKWVMCGAFLSCIAFISHGLVDFDLYEPAVALNAWVCLGLFMKYADEDLSPKIFRVAKNWQKILGIVAGQILVIGAILFLRGPYRADVFLDKGIKAWGAKDLTEAAYYVHQSLKSNPMNANALYLEASILEVQNKPRYAIQSYEAAMKKDPFNPIYPYRTALIYEYLQKKESQDYSGKILELLNRSVQKYPVQPGYRMKLAKFLESVGRYEDALLEYEKARSLGADSLQLRETIRRLKGKHEKNLSHSRT